MIVGVGHALALRQSRPYVAPPDAVCPSDAHLSSPNELTSANTANANKSTAQKMPTTLADGVFSARHASDWTLNRIADIMPHFQVVMMQTLDYAPAPRQIKSCTFSQLSACAHFGVVYCRVMQKISKRVLAQRAKGPPPPRHKHRAYWMWRRARVVLKMKTCVRYVKRNMKAEADR